MKRSKVRFLAAAIVSLAVAAAFLLTHAGTYLVLSNANTGKAYLANESTASSILSPPIIDILIQIQ